MNGDKTQAFWNLVEHRAVDMVVKMLLGSVTVGLVTWLWFTTERIVVLEQSKKGDRAQWSVIKQTTDETTTLRVKVDVLERMLAGQELKDDPAARKLFAKIEAEHGRRRAEDLKAFIQAQHVEPGEGRE